MAGPAAPAPAEAGPPAAPEGIATGAELSIAERTRKIDASLIRLKAAHAGVGTDDSPAKEKRRPAGHEIGELTPARRAAGLAGRAVAACLAVLCLVGLGVGWSANGWMNSTIRPVVALDPASGGTPGAGENLLLFGTTSGSSGDQPSGSPRADALSLIHLREDGTGVTVAFPLQTEINRPPCQRWDPAAAAYLNETVPAQPLTTLASAYTVGGPQCLVRAVQQLSGLEVSRFVALDVPGLAEMVDAVGGVEICVERPVVDDELGPIVTQPGWSEIDGAGAVRFAEAAAVPTDTSSSFGHTQRQQRLLAAVFGKALSGGVVLSPGSTRDFAAALGRSMLADSTDVTDMVRYTSAASTPDAAIVAVPVDPVPNTRGNLEVRAAEAAKLFSAIRKGEQVSAPAEPTTTNQPAPGELTVGVLNAAGRDGLATQIADNLRALGFGIGSVGNSATPSAETVLRFSPDQAAAARVVSEAVPSAQLLQDLSGTGTLELVLGSSFDGTVRAPQTASDSTPGVRCE